MTRTHTFALAAALVGALAALGCSSSSSSNNGSSSTSTACVVGTGATQSCTANFGLTASQIKTANDVCTKMGGTAAGSCPTTNQIGCCKNPKDKYQATACYYRAGDAGTTGGDAGAVNNYQQGCAQTGGIWTTP